MIGLDFYLMAYHELKFDGINGFGAGAIPWTAIAKWAKINHINSADDIALLVRYIRTIESTIAMYNAKKEQSK